MRCARAQFRLRPDRQRVEALGFFLGRALEAHPGIRLHAFVQMSNHAHLVVTDGDGVLDQFMARFLGPLAKTINAMDGVRGQFLERRYSAIEVLDDEALLERIVYTVTNPVAADLVTAINEWPGLCFFPGGSEGGTFTRFRKHAYHRTVQAAGGDRRRIREKDFTDTAKVEICPPELVGRDVRRELQAAVHDCLARLGKDRGRRRVLGVKKVLAQKVFDAPERPKNSPMPLCHTSCGALWQKFRDRWRAFVRAYREASAAFRAGVLLVPFPEWAFRPPVRPLDRVLR